MADKIKIGQNSPFCQSCDIGFSVLNTLTDSGQS